MTLSEQIKSSFNGALLGYKSSMESLNWATITATFVLTPVFYLLFFFMVRLQSIEPAQISIYLLLSILILPTGSCIFYLGTSFHKLKMWGVLRHLIIAERSLLNIALHKSFVTVTISFCVSMFWLLVLESFVIDTGLSLNQWLVLVSILLFSCLTFVCFGILCATAVLPLKDRLIVTNSLFFIVIIFSGLIFQSDHGVVYWASHLLPITPFISAMKAMILGQPYIHFLAIALFNSIMYLVISQLMVNFMMRKLLQGDTDF